MKNYIWQKKWEEIDVNVRGLKKNVTVQGHPSIHAKGVDTWV